MSVLVVWFLAAASVGCSSSSCDGVMVGSQCVPLEEDALTDTGIAGHECIRDDQCLPLSVCIAGKCARDCTSDSQCAAGLSCLKYRCIDPDYPDDIVDIPEKDHAQQVPCTTHVECADLDMACIDGYCDRECTEDWHCEDANRVCNHFRCVDAGSEDIFIPSDVTPQDLPLDHFEDSLDLAPGCEEKDGKYGDPCLCSLACESKLCVPNKLGSGQCTVKCNFDSDCPLSDVCIEVQQDAQTFASVCVPNDSGQAIPCNETLRNPQTDFCYKTLYLQNQVGQCACATTCVGASDCPQGTACHLLNNQKVCVSVGELCSSANKVCFGVCAGTGTQGFCTNLCVSNNDCPVAWTCQPVQEGVTVCSP